MFLLGKIQNQQPNLSSESRGARSKRTLLRLFLLLLHRPCRPVLFPACKVEELGSHDWGCYIARDLNKRAAQQQ